MNDEPGRKERKNYTPEEKVAILKRHLVDHVPVSDLCDQHHLNPNVFYRWLKEFWENGAVVFEQKRDRPSVQMERKIQQLEHTVADKNAVIAELLAAHMDLKKTLGED